MCGIAGTFFFDPQRVLDRDTLLRMTRTQTHRGPDDEGIYQQGPCSLGFRRLSVLDLSESGRQPMLNEDGTVALVCNGEIYNFNELRTILADKGHIFRSRTDVEVVVHGYEEWGENVFERLDGMFALAIWDGKNNRLVLARDRFGIKPLHYACVPDGVIFGSEMKAVLAYPHVPRRLNVHALWNYLTFAQVPAPETIYQSIRKLLPGHKLVVDANRIRMERYYRLPTQRNRVGSVEQLAAEYLVLLEQAVKTHLVADVPVGCFLSGGIDSSLLVALASRVARGPVQTFSVEFENAPEVDEGRYQTLVANQFGTEHHVLRASPDLLQYMPAMLQAVDEPFAIASFLPLYVLSEMTAKHVKVVLSGDGADELFGGYGGRYVGDRKRLWLGRALSLLSRRDQLDDRIWFNRTWRERCKRRSRMALMPLLERYITSYNWFWNAEKWVLLQPNALNMLQGGLGYGEWIERAWVEEENELGRKLRYEFLVPLPDEMLAKSDRATSAFGLEARVPYLDKRAAEFAWSISPSTHWRGGRGKRVLKAAARGVLPDIVIDRPKSGFNVPISRWLCDDRSDVKKVLLDPVKSFDELIRPEAVRNMLQAHEAGKGANSARLWVLYVLKYWMILNPTCQV
jgi:asparagine synthase (glutamine-hydrolysing)